MIAINIERRNQIIAMGITLLFHALLFLFLILMMIHTPIPPYPENAESIGLEVNFGYDDQGMGDVSTTNPSNPQPEVRSEKSEVRNQTSEASDNPNVVTQDAEESAVVQTSTVTVKEQQEVPQPDNALLAAMNKINNSKSNTTSNDGITGNPGNQGNPNGDVNSKNYDGDPGNGGNDKVKSFLKGRKLLHVPDIIDDSQDEGIVAIDIIVDKKGNVSRANVNYQKSNTTSSVLLAKARQAALKLKYNENPYGTEEQKGTIQFSFRFSK